MHIHKCISIHICAQPAARVFADVYVGVKTYLCNVHTCPCTSVQNNCSKVHVTLTAKKCTYILYIYMSAHIHTYTYIHTRIQNVHTNFGTGVLECMQHSLQKNAHIYIPTLICIRIHMYTNTHAHALHRPHTEALILRPTIYAQICIHIHIHIHMCINAYIDIYIHTCTYLYIYMSAHIHTYAYIHKHIQNVHMNTRKARLKRRRGSDCAESPTCPQLTERIHKHIWK